MSSQRNYYEILNSTTNATFDELKHNYKQLILQYHPDKLQQDRLETTRYVADANDDDDDPNASLIHDSSEFLIINEAWNTLKDPIKRKCYDSELLLTKFQSHSNIFERLTLADMEEQHHQGIDIEKGQQDTTETFYTHKCRCGGQYVIDESEATDNGIYKSHQKIANRHSGHSHTGLTAHNNDKDNDCANACQDDNEDHDDDDDENKVTDTTDDSEVMVECNECSLVIVLSNAKLSSNAS